MTMAPEQHFGLIDPDYDLRRRAIARQAGGSSQPPTRIQYLDREHQTWKTARTTLARRWQHDAIAEIVQADFDLDLPTNRVPQLDEVTANLRELSGYRYRSVAGLVPVEEFFSSLADGIFLSTQFLRHHDSPLYTPEPDIIHEVIGHATCLAVPELAELHRAAGRAMVRVDRAESRQFLADVFWFSVEFGVIGGLSSGGVARSTHAGPKAYGAGLLSSVGELNQLRSVELRPLDVAAMGTQDYDIDSYQRVLFAAESLGHVADVVGGFFDEATDDTICALRQTS